MIRSIEPQEGASGLVPHHHGLTLRGTPADAKFPPLCPNCGGAASRTIACSKVFAREGDEGPSAYIVTTATVPFCDPCIATHRAQEVKPTAIETLKSSFASMHMVGAVFPALAALFLARLALGDLFHGRRLLPMLFELGLCALAALIAWGQGWAVWRDRARFRVPPQTEVTKAFDFSDDTAPAFEGGRFACTIRDGRFAEAFRRLNVESEYVAGSARAVAERRRSNLALWIVGGIVAIAVVRSLVEDLIK